MFILDSLMISGIRWALKTVVTAAEAEMNDDTALREQLLEAEMRREMGEISDEAYAELEADLLARIREIKERREGAGPLAFGGASPIDATPDSRFQVEASISGDFHEPAAAPHTTVVEHSPAALQQTTVLDMEPGAAEPPAAPGLPLTPSPPSRARLGAARPERTRATRTTSTRTSSRPRTRRQGASTPRHVGSASRTGATAPRTDTTAPRPADAGATRTGANRPVRRRTRT